MLVHVMLFQPPQDIYSEVAFSPINMLGEHKSYHQSINKEEAERRLSLYGKHSYLTRYSRRKGQYMLTVFQRQTPKDEVIEFKITINNGKYCIEGREDNEYGDIGSLLHYYENHRIHPSFKTIGKSYTLEKYNMRKQCQIL